MKKKKPSFKKSQKRSQSNKEKSRLNQNAETPLTSENEAVSDAPTPLDTEAVSEDIQNESAPEADHTEIISEEAAASNDKADEYAEKQEVADSESTDAAVEDAPLERTEVTDEDASPEKDETQAQNHQNTSMKDEEIERMAAVLSAVPAKEEPDEPMLFKKEKIRKHKPYQHVRGWLLVGLMFLLSVGATILTFITIERLYTNLSPYLGAFFGLFAVVAVLHVLINVNRLPYWGFTVFPILVIGAIGVVLLAFDQYVDNIFYMYVIIGIWGVAMLAFVHSMLLKGLMPKGWFFLMVPSIIVVAASVIFSFYPFVLSYGESIGIIYDAVSAITPLMITRGFFIAISIVMFIDVLIWFIVKVQEKDRLGLTAAQKKKDQNATEKSEAKQDETTNKTDNQEKKPIDQVDSET